MEETLKTAIIAGSAGVIGIILGAVLGPWIGWIFEKRRQASLQINETRKTQLEIYKPLYEEFVLMPKNPPEHYFSDWEEDEFQDWLFSVKNKLMPNLHWLPTEVLEKIPGYQELTSIPDESCEPAVRWLYKHIDVKFKLLRKQLKIE